MTELVGILNITPDSFSDGGQWNSTKLATERAQQLLREGASMIDIGAESTRPGARPLRSDEEWMRLEPALRHISTTATLLSIDSRHPDTIRRCLELRPDIIVNDVTGLHDPTMRALVATHKLRCIVSHLPHAANGDIQDAHRSQLIDSEQQVLDELMARIHLLTQNGISIEQIILDPGVGFGKTKELNLKLLSFARHVPKCDVMIGYSRKRFLGDDRLLLTPNLAAGRIAIKAGARYLRVHDVAGHRQLFD